MKLLLGTFSQGWNRRRMRRGHVFQGRYKSIPVNASDSDPYYFNNAALFGPAFDPQADPDGDGWTNSQEAAAGTDPANPNPPDGFILPQITHIPEVRADDNNDGIPGPVSPQAVHITWPTLPGKQHTLLFSADLGVGSWTPVENPFIGTGNSLRLRDDLSGSWLF